MNWFHALVPPLTILRAHKHAQKLTKIINNYPPRERSAKATRIFWTGTRFCSGDVLMQHRRFIL